MRAGFLDREFELSALRSFRCFAGAGVWYEREARGVLNRAISLFASDDLKERDLLLLFWWDDELLAVSVVAEETERTAHLAFVGLKTELHGARIDSVDGPRLSDAVVETSLDEAEGLGFDRVTAQVAREHQRSLALLHRAGFAFASRFDHYDVQAVSLR